VVTFLVTSPAIPLHLAQVIDDLAFEARAVHPGADGLSPLGNAAWSALEVLPATVGLPMLALAAAGAVALARRAPSALAVLAAFALGYLATVSLSPLHWDRYVIPLVPVVAILAGVGLASLPAAIERVARGTRPNEGAARAMTGVQGSPASAPAGPMRVAAFVAAVGIALMVLAPGALTVVERNSRLATPSTRAIATAWLESTLAPGTLVCEEMYTAYEPGGGIELFRIFALADEPMQAYLDRGCRYLLESSTMADRFKDAARYPRESAFYEALPSAARLVRTFEPGPGGRGPIIRAYLLDG
jgi:4-amino-4-deoxy-L-arabinose transferase-like glycosyltransferase